MGRGGRATRARARRRESELVALIARIGDGEQEALAALYDATSALVYSLAARILRDEGAAEDVTLEVYLQVYALAPSYDPARGSPSAWLVTLARSRAIDRLRAEQQRMRVEEPLDAALDLTVAPDDPEASAGAAERGRLARAALASLAPEQREAIEIAYFFGLSHREIAARLGQPLGTVKTRIRAGMMRLRDVLGPLLAEELR
jgi:RNA polymerase sigma-70 factor (ECF subfamily)